MRSCAPNQRQLGKSIELSTKIGYRGYSSKDHFVEGPGTGELHVLRPPSSPDSPAISLDQLIALTDEIAALVRAGVPLEQGLVHLGGDMPGRLGTIAETIATELQRGDSLVDVLDRYPSSFPPVYRAVVQAGIKAGRLSAALESVASSARRLAETRRMIVAAFLYPLLVFLVAWGLFIFFVAKIAPAMLPPLNSFDVAARHFIAWLSQMGQSMEYWGPAVPAIVVAAAVWFSRTGRAMLLGSDSGGALLGWLPWMAAMLRSFRIAAFTDVLATLVQQEVPLAEGIVLAAEAVGDRKILAASKEIAAAIERGNLPGSSPPESSPPSHSGFPPLVDWLVRSGHERGTLRDALRHASDIYYRRASRQAMAARVLLPTLSVAVIGGGITLAYGAILFGPWLSLLYSLAEV